MQYDQVKFGVGYINKTTQFFDTMVQSDLREIEPHDELITAGDNAIVAANQGQEYILYDENGGQVSLDLRGTEGGFSTIWYNPRTEEIPEMDKVSGGEVVDFKSPSSGEDWVLLLQNSSD